MSFIVQVDRKLLLFFFHFLVLSLFFQTIIWGISDTLVAEIIQNNLAKLATELGRLFLDNIELIDNRLIHPDSGYFVVVDHKCTALHLIATLLSATLALNFRWMTKVVMAVSVIILIQVENILRILHLYVEVENTINQFNFYHLYVWQGINFITAILVFWMLYTMAQYYEDNAKFRNKNKN